MKSIILLSACISALFCFECREQNKASASSVPPLIATVPLPFTPPADSIITPARFLAWFSCNGKLDSQSLRYFDFQSSTNPIFLDSVAHAFSASQDSVCVTNGLPGGYKEYQWIRDNLGGVNNKARFDSIKGVQATNAPPLSPQ